MEEKTVPWWRKALSYALGGIRSGFGLFSRNAKNKASGALEIVAWQEKNPEEETALTEHSPKLESGAEAVNEAVATPLPETARVADPIEPSERMADLEAAPEVESVAAQEPVDKPANADEPAAEPAAAPVELINTAVETAPEQTAGQLAAREAESDSGAAPAAEAPPKPALETADPPMDKFESIPEQPDGLAEPDPAGGAVGAAEPALSVAAEPVKAAGEPAEESAIEAASELAQESAASSSAAQISASAQEPALPPAPKPFIKLESRDNEADLSPFSVIVAQVYDGPLDLLLDLIRKQDIDIYDIPIARITAQFLAYVDQLKATDVDVAGEFIYTASLLIHIKSKMLLPRAPAGPDDAAEDPRRELVERLLEHERFKNAAQMLQQKQMLEAATWTNPGLREFQDDASAEPEIAADTVDLVRIFRDIIERARNRPVIDVEEDSVTVGQMIQFLARRLTMEDKPVALRRLLSHTRSERALIAMFLALLELVRLQAILLRQDRQFSEIFIKKHIGFEGVMNEGLANARDDWR